MFLLLWRHVAEIKNLGHCLPDFKMSAEIIRSHDFRKIHVTFHLLPTVAGKAVVLDEGTDR